MKRKALTFSAYDDFDRFVTFFTVMSPFLLKFVVIVLRIQNIGGYSFNNKIIMNHCLTFLLNVFLNCVHETLQSKTKTSSGCNSHDSFMLRNALQITFHVYSIKIMDCHPNTTDFNIDDTWLCLKWRKIQFSRFQKHISHLKLTTIVQTWCNKVDNFQLYVASFCCHFSIG